MSFGQNVNIPDANFKNYLLAHTDFSGVLDINTNGDSEIQVSEANAYAGKISCNGSNISDLTGIEAFTSLTELDCSSNELTSFDLSNNTELNYLRCIGNPITSFDLSNNTALTYLDCSSMKLTSLDVSNNTALEYLFCSHQFSPILFPNDTSSVRLTSIDISNNVNLIEFFCHYNDITEIDVSNQPNMSHLNVSYNQLECFNFKNGNTSGINSCYAEGNPNLTCIEVSDLSAITQVWIIDPQTTFSENCNNACSNTSNISELNTTTKQLVKIVDVLGREARFKPNTPLLFIYNDGKVERKMIIEE